MAFAGDSVIFTLVGIEMTNIAIGIPDDYVHFITVISENIYSPPCVNNTRQSNVDKNLKHDWLEKVFVVLSFTIGYYYSK